MIEQQRLHYLAALGIDNYVPKRILTNATASVALVAYEPEETDEHKPNDKAAFAVEPIAQSSRAEPNEPEVLLQPEAEPVEAPGSKDGLPQAESAQKALQVATPKARPEIASNASVKPLRFTLSLWAITPQLLVVDTRQTGSALPTDKLLQNILRAVGYPLAQLPQSELVRWPIFKQDPQANNTEEAFAMVQANIGARCAKAPEMQLLLMGETAAKFVIGGHEQYQGYEQHLGQTLVCEPWQASAIVLPSLVEILEEPSKKSMVWQALQPLFVTEQ